MKKSEIINQIIDGIMYAHMAIPCIGFIAIILLVFIDRSYAAVLAFMFCGVYMLEVMVALMTMSSLDTLRDKIKANEET